MKTQTSLPVRTLKAIADRCRMVLDKLPGRVVISGGEVMCEGVPLRFPKGVGLSYTTNFFWHGDKGYEPTTTKILLGFMKGARHFMDVGSNIGLYSVLARKLFPSIRVDAFEAVPSIFEKNIAFHRANGVSTEGVVQKACSNENGTSTIFLPLFGEGLEEDQTATLRTDSWQHQQDKRQEIKVETVRVDDYLKDRPAVAPLLMKIDVEDHEAAVLEGAKETISAMRPIILCEMLPREHGNQQTWKILEACDYSGFAITAAGLFRFEAADSSFDREIKDFLCVPREFGELFSHYLPFAKLSEIRTQWASGKAGGVQASSQVFPG